MMPWASRRIPKEGLESKYVMAVARRRPFQLELTTGSGSLGKQMRYIRHFSEIKHRITAMGAGRTVDGPLLKRLRHPSLDA